MIEPTPMQRARALDREIEMAESQVKLTAPSAFIQAISVPGELVPVFTSGRPELMRLVARRSLDEADCDVLYKVIEALLATNHELQKHAETTARIVRAWQGHAKDLAGLVTQLHEAYGQLQRLGPRIDRFVNFGNKPNEVEDDE